MASTADSVNMTTHATRRKTRTIIKERHPCSYVHQCERKKGIM